MKAKIVRWSPHSLSTEVGTIQTLSGHLGVNSLPYSLLLLPSVLPILNTDLEAGPHSELFRDGHSIHKGTAPGPPWMVTSVDALPSQGFYCCCETPWPKATWGETYTSTSSPMWKEVMARTQTGPELRPRTERSATYWLVLSRRTPSAFLYTPGLPAKGRPHLL